MSRPYCRKCLLENIDAKGVYKRIAELVKALPEDMKAEEGEYRRRLDICRKCYSLQEGICGECGCFVELRAAKKKMYCPSERHLW